MHSISALRHHPIIRRYQPLYPAIPSFVTHTEYTTHTDTKALQELRQMLGWAQHTRKDEALIRACMKNKYLGIEFRPEIRTG